MDDQSLRHVVLFVGKYHSPSTIELIETLADAFPHWRWTIFQEVPPRRWRPYLRTKLRRLRKEPLSYPLEVLHQLAVKLRRRKSRPATGRVHLPPCPGDLRRDNLAYQRCRSLHDPEILQQIRSLKPWLGVSISAPILKPGLFTIPELGTINLHKGLLPRYRGMPPGFWELHEEASEAGVTVHWINKGLDTGDIIAERRMPAPPFTTVAGLQAELDLLGDDALRTALQQIEDGTAPRRPQAAASTKANTQPPWLLARRVRRRLLRKRRARKDQSWSRALLKRAALLSFVYLWCPLRNALRRMTGRCHTTVLLYHRVSDHFLDSVTVGVEQFQEQLRLLRRCYDVLDLATFLAQRDKPRRRPAVVLTFDDGYQDNYLAARLLRRQGLPCTFFLSTRIVGSDAAFPQDLKRLGRRVAALSWDQVRQMRQWGFDFSNHTAHHAHLAALPADEALGEVATAVADLRREVNGAAVLDCLAYPYGKPEDISDEIKDRLAEVGVEYCFSAFGGVNYPNFDRRNILRQGIDHNFSLLAFRAAVEGWTQDWRNQA
jgi:peptidoglycan/xylan/chitin deacetylase (PgdA/CDA1 family)/folate-dependent phosphoribosylglycinamide formyltransferase PurN